MEQGFLIDMDGVMYRGSQLIPGADRFIRELLEPGSSALGLPRCDSRLTPWFMALRCG